MPLALTFRVGEDFYINDQQFHLSSVAGPDLATVVSEAGTYELTDHRATEIYPNCRASLSEKCTHTSARIVFDAPRSLRIATGEKIRLGSQPKASHRPEISAPTGRAVTVSTKAVSEALAIGFKGAVANELGELVRIAAPVTHERGNRRFEDLIFEVADNTLRSVYRLTDEEFEQLDNRSFKRRRELARAKKNEGN